MPNSSIIPTIAIVGRPNVGKSAIFNRLVGRRISIVHDEPGVTRDRVDATAGIGPFSASFIDTGGIGSTVDADFSEQVGTEVDIAIATADLILFTVDAREGITSIDESIAALLRRSATPVILVVNKADNPADDHLESDFARLGFKLSHPVSAEHGRHFPELVRTITGKLKDLSFFPSAGNDAEGEEAGPPVEIALVGRPNVGKSSLVNAILEDNRTIVSDVAGTTRDAVDVAYEHGGVKYTLIDTAGIRPRTKRSSSIEAFSVMRSERSIRRADLSLLVIDSAAGVSAQDRRIARQILKAGKPCIILLNKFDLYHPDGPFKDRIALLTEHVKTELFFLHYATFVAVSALEGKHINKVFHAVDRLRGAATRVPTTGVLNRILQRAVTKTAPPSKGGKRFNLLYASPRKTDRPAAIPVPEYLLFVNRASLLTRSYERYLENDLRANHDFEGLPILFEIRSRSKGLLAQHGGSRSPEKPPRRK